MPGHACTGQFRLIDIAQSALAIGIAFRTSLREVGKSGARLVITLQVGERLPVTEDGVRKIGAAARAFVSSSCAAAKSSSLCFCTPSI